jgi:hypothetical protein
MKLYLHACICPQVRFPCTGALRRVRGHAISHLRSKTIQQTGVQVDVWVVHSRRACLNG